MKKLLVLAVVIGAIALLARLAAAQKTEWQNLTEPELRAKLDTKLPSRIADEQRAEIAEAVVSGMRERGMLRDEASADERPDIETESV